ncbi:MAG: DUF4202 domain-containing protein [Cellvibrionaceae bacterium]|nr:DUF4202 domain-containing protein [Cellvibrionaceae bacterium]
MSERLINCWAQIDQTNRADPNSDSEGQPKALLYGQRMSQCLAQFAPKASEHLQIAVRAQHIQRWAIPRSDYPMDRAGYLRWRRNLGRHHAEVCGQIMAELGYSPSDIDTVAGLLQKQNLKQNPDTQTLEDVACLVFLEFYFKPFAKAHSRDKIISILQKTWAKMSPAGQAAALQLPLGEAELALVQQALG